MDIHVVHLGTMGVYGYGTAGMKIPEGYLQIKVDTGDGVWSSRRSSTPPTRQHLPHDEDAGPAAVRVTTTRTTTSGSPTCTRASSGARRRKETKRDERLINRFDYDGDYGTVLNRFLMQAAIGYPLTVHGTGGQTRAFIHIQDTVRCIELALENPPARGRPCAHLQPDDRDPPRP